MSEDQMFGSCDECDKPYVLGSDDHDPESGLCWDCVGVEEHIPLCPCDAAQQPCNKAWHRKDV